MDPRIANAQQEINSLYEEITRLRTEINSIQSKCMHSFGHNPNLSRAEYVICKKCGILV
jgi:hypothetical protein